MTLTTDNTSSFFGSVIDSDKLQNFQDKFCKSLGVYVMCLDADGEPITNMSGSSSDLVRIGNIVTEKLIDDLFRRVSVDELEDQAIEDTEVPYVKYGAVSIKHEGKSVITWIFVGVLSDIADEMGVTIADTDFSRTTTMGGFESGMDLLREGVQDIIFNKLVSESARADSERSENSMNKTASALKRSEAMTEVVQFLDHDEEIEAILTSIMEVMGAYLGISDAYLYRIEQKDENLVEIIAEWQNSGVASYHDKNRDIKRYAYLTGEKPLVISAGSKNDACREDMEKNGLLALVSMPIVINDKVTMYACFEEQTRARNWDVEDIKFMNDASKVLQSIIQRRINKNSLASSYQALEAVLDNVGSAIYVRDIASRRILFVNRTLRSGFRLELERGLLAEIFESKIPEFSENGSIEIEYEERGGWYDLYYTSIHWVDGRPVLLCSIHDITEKKAYQRRIEQQAYTDFLTGLYNRMCCERDLAKYVDTAKRMNTEGALLYLDLDDFKHINDGLGHQYGDVLLKSISHSLQRIHGIQNTCYRMGGDEFVIIIPPSENPKFEDIVEGIKGIFAKPWFLKDADYYCTMSMGIVQFPEEGEIVQDLIKKADVAMYEAKKSGKNRVATYKSNSGAESSKRLDMEKNMREATVSGYKEFEVYYQPIIDTELGNICTGAEALIRWNSEEMGFINPADFIPLAEYLGLINPIGNFVLKEACKACKRWNDSGHPNYKVNVNLSVVQLLQTDIVDIVERILNETKINPENLTLEVTESLAINDMERMKAILNKIKKLGVHIALDDFGTGYSSLNHIREIPLDVIKVDQCFSAELSNDEFSKSFIRMVSELAVAIGVKVCVEGIETKAQVDVLKDMKVRLIQGFYYDKPMAKDEFEAKYVIPRGNIVPEGADV